MNNKYVVCFVFLITSMHHTVYSFSWDTVSSWFTSPKNNAVFTKEYELSNKGNITLTNPYGDIRITTWNKNKVMLQATTRGTPEEIAAVKIDVNYTKGSLLINSHIPENASTHIDYVLIVPEQAELIITAQEKGSITIKNAKNRSYISAHHGNIKLHRCSGNIHAQTDKGNITLKVAQLIHDDSLFCEITQKGTITFLTTPTLNANFVCTVHNGTILSEIPLTLEPITTILTKQIWEQLQSNIHACSGKGGAPLTLQSHNGNIIIKEHKNI